MEEVGGGTSRFLHVDGKAADYFTSCGSTSFPALLQEQLDSLENKEGSGSGSEGTTTEGVAAASTKRRSPKKIKVS
eukprot:g6288.t1